MTVTVTITHTHLQVVLEIPGLLNHQVASSSEVLHRSQNTLVTQVSCLCAVLTVRCVSVTLCVSACVIHRFHNSITGPGSTCSDSTGTRTLHAASNAAVLTAASHGTAAVHATDTLQFHVPPTAQRAVPAAVHAQLSSFCVLSAQSDDAAKPWPSPI